jgi:hypothetical protein
VTQVDEPPAEADLALLAYGRNVHGEEYRVFELRDPRPMAWLVYDAIVAEGNPAWAREFIADPDVNLRDTAILTAAPPIALGGQRPLDASADFSMPTPEEMAITVTTSEPALLTLAVPMYPGWTAMVDGQPIPILDAYAGLMAVPLPTGEAMDVRVTFDPPLFRVSLALSFVTALLALIAGVAGAVVWRRG